MGSEKGDNLPFKEDGCMGMMSSLWSCLPISEVGGEIWKSERE